MKKNILGVALGALLCALSLPVHAQQPKKVPRIGFLTASSVSSMAARTEALRQGLRDLGYVEGKDIVIEYRDADEKFDRLLALVAELTRLKGGCNRFGWSCSDPCCQASDLYDSHRHGV